MNMAGPGMNSQKAQVYCEPFELIYTSISASVDRLESKLENSYLRDSPALQ